MAFVVKRLTCKKGDNTLVTYAWTVDGTVLMNVINDFCKMP